MKKSNPPMVMLPASQPATAHKRTSRIVIMSPPKATLVRSLTVSIYLNTQTTMISKGNSNLVDGNGLTQSLRELTHAHEAVILQLSVALQSLYLEGTTTPANRKATHTSTIRMSLT